MQSTKKQLFNTVLEDGNNYLHDMILKCNSSSDVEKIKKYIKKIGFENVRKMAQQQNFKGKLPFDLIDKLKLEDEDKNTLKKIIMPSMLASDVSGLSIKLSLKSILKEYKVKPTSLLGKNLIIACEIINKTRELITASETHPSTNQDSKEDRVEKYNKINGNRVKIKKLKEKYALSPEQDQLLEEITSLIKTEGAGNCYEYSMLAKQILGNKVPAAVCEITDGDHTVLFIDPTSEYGVVCDAWAGRALPISALTTQLGIHRMVNEDGIVKHFTAAYNPKLNKFKQIFPIIPSPSILEIKPPQSLMGPKDSLAPHAVLFSSTNKPKEYFSPSSHKAKASVIR